MFRFTKPLLSCLMLGGLLAAVSRPAAAQTWDSAGVVRITDNRAAIQASSHIAPLPEGAVPNSYCPHCPQQGMVVDGAPCPYGCPGPCGHGRCRDCARRFLDWLNPHGGCTLSPDHGFAPPVRRPIYRTPVAYRKMYPDAMTGAPALPQQRVPSVYMPTDTTQLGYYYQHVPYWQPRPGFTPPAPNPHEWHTSMCEVQGPGHPAGVILGTSPQLIPMTGAPAYAEPTTAAPYQTAELPTLERTSGSPQLLPIE